MEYVWMVGLVALSVVYVVCVVIIARLLSVVSVVCVVIIARLLKDARRAVEFDYRTIESSSINATKLRYTIEAINRQVARGKGN